jgi:inosine-uridine nucleoside N-ribohydrolase
MKTNYKLMKCNIITLTHIPHFYKKNIIYVYKMNIRSTCCCSSDINKSTCNLYGCKDVPQQWFYYADSNGDDLQMIIREIKDPLFCPIAYVGSKVGFTSNSTIFRRFLALLNIKNFPVADGYIVPVSGDENLHQGLLDYQAPGPEPSIQKLGDMLWFAADLYLPPPEDAVPLSQFPSHVLLRKAIFRALRTKKKFGIRITGPATDAALDLRANEDLPLQDAICEIRFLAGSIDVAGNIFTLVPPASEVNNTYGDFNIYLDPQGFIDVLSIASRHGILVNMIAHDATNMCQITREYFDSSLRVNTFVTTEGKAIGQFFENVRSAFGDSVFFNDAGTPGGGFYQWDAHTSRLDEITGWECTFYNVETKPLVPTSGWIFRTSCDKGYPIRVGMALDCQLFRQRWKPIFDKPYTGNLPCVNQTIESEPLLIHRCTKSFIKYAKQNKIECDYKKSKKKCEEPKHHDSSSNDEDNNRRYKLDGKPCCKQCQESK